MFRKINRQRPINIRKKCLGDEEIDTATNSNLDSPVLAEVEEQDSKPTIESNKAPGIFIELIVFL